MKCTGTVPVSTAALRQMYTQSSHERKMCLVLACIPWLVLHGDFTADVLWSFERDMMQRGPPDVDLFEKLALASSAVREANPDPKPGPAFVCGECRAEPTVGEQWSQAVFPDGGVVMLCPTCRKQPKWQGGSARLEDLN